MALVLPLLLWGMALWTLDHLGDPLPSESNPVVANIDEVLSKGDLGLVVLGSSVTMAGIDAAGLGRGLVSGRSISLAHRGGQPAHWLATVRHRMVPEKAPSVVLLYVPLHTLDHGELTAEADRGLLVDLLTRPDPGLLERGLGTVEGGTAWDRIQLGRERTRGALLDRLGRQPARWFWGDEPVSEATLGQRQTPRNPADRGTATPGVPGVGSPAVIEPSRLPFSASFMPDLVEEVQSLGARLVVVVPVIEPGSRKGPACQYNSREAEVVEGLLLLGADIIDVSDIDILEEDFETRQHLNARGRARLQPVLRGWVQALDLQSTAVAAPGRLVGCSE